MIEKIKGYKNLNRKELHRLFRCDISEFIFDYNDETSIEERRIAMAAERTLAVKLKRFPKVSYPIKTHTPDFASVDQKIVVVEVKRIKSLKNGFDKAFRRAKKQFYLLSLEVNKEVFIDIELLGGNCDEIINKAVKCAKNREIDSFYLIKNNEVIYHYKK